MNDIDQPALDPDEEELLISFGSGPRIWDAASVFAKVLRLEAKGLVSPVAENGLYGLTESGWRRLGAPHGFICKKCAGPSPVGIGYVADGRDAAAASAGRVSCACGWSQLFTPINAEGLAALSDDRFDALDELVSAERLKRTIVKVVTAVRKVLDERRGTEDGLPESFGEPATVTFDTSEWENGHFFSGTAVVADTGGEAEPIDFSETPVEDLMSDMAVMFSLGVGTTAVLDLRACTFEVE